MSAHTKSLVDLLKSIPRNASVYATHPLFEPGERMIDVLPAGELAHLAAAHIEGLRDEVQELRCRLDVLTNHIEELQQEAHTHAEVSS